MKRNQKSIKRIIEALLFVVVLALGWRYPYLAYCLVLNVAVGLVSALRHGGRHGCGMVAAPSVRAERSIRCCPTRSEKFLPGFWNVRRPLW